ncbi:polymorphic toxin type 47 domain-containing protein [Pseudomonas sp. PIC25]|uniref:polymorphic toxin type 47 domain-containing protein n=1 Tax=Pseudomonas sp. PIC25 TaxID=1958773 RepID=UPI00117A6B76
MHLKTNPQAPGPNWEFNSDKDLDIRYTGTTYRDALDEAFKRIGVPKGQFWTTR